MDDQENNEMLDDLGVEDAYEQYLARKREREADGPNEIEVSIQLNEMDCLVILDVFQMAQDRIGFSAASTLKVNRVEAIVSRALATARDNRARV